MRGGDILKLSRSSAPYCIPLAGPGSLAWYPHYLTYSSDLKWSPAPAIISGDGMVLLYLPQSQSQSQSPPAGYSFSLPRLGLRCGLGAASLILTSS